MLPQKRFKWWEFEKRAGRNAPFFTTSGTSANAGERCGEGVKAGAIRAYLRGKLAEALPKGMHDLAQGGLHTAEAPFNCLGKDLERDRLLALHGCLGALLLYIAAKRHLSSVLLAKPLGCH